MPIPTFDALPIFGVVYRFSHEIGTPQVQQIAAAGVDGQGALPMGARGLTVAVQGIISGADLPSFNLAWNTFFGYRDSRYYVLADNRGNVFPFATLRSFGAAGELARDRSGRWGLIQPYRATFEVPK